MRIGIGQLWQESNTFNRNPTTLEAYQSWGVVHGDEVLAQYGTTGELGGIRDALLQWSPAPSLVGLSRYVCWSWGAIEGEAWDTILGDFRTSLKEAGPLDAVVFALHGALAATNEPDVTGALLEEVRKFIGPDVPLVGTLDLHANITKRMVQAADVLVGYHTSPHLDQYETGVRAVRALRKILETGRRPLKSAVKLPFFTPAELHNTFNGPPAPLYRELERLEAMDSISSAGIYMVMPWFDTPELGWTVLLYGEGKLDTISAGLAERCWNLREEISDVERLSPSDAIEAAQKVDRGPVVIGEGSDATNSGAPGDSTVLLRELLKHQPIKQGAMTFVVDPDAVSECERIGVGGTVSTFVGGTYSPEFSEPVKLQGEVVRLFELKYKLTGHGGKNMPVSMGKSVVVRAGDVSVVLTSKSGPGSSPMLYEAAGLDPRNCGIVIAKSPAGFRADYEPFVTKVILADSPGCATPSWHRLRFVKCNHPIWPLEELESPVEAEWASNWNRTVLPVVK